MVGKINCQHTIKELIHIFNYLADDKQSAVIVRILVPRPIRNSVVRRREALLLDVNLVQTIITFIQLFEYNRLQIFSKP